MEHLLSTAGLPKYGYTVSTSKHVSMPICCCRFVLILFSIWRRDRCSLYYPTDLCCLERQDTAVNESCSMWTDELGLGVSINHNTAACLTFADLFVKGNAVFGHSSSIPRNDYQ